MRSQAFLAAAIVFMLASGIGATTAIFSLVHGVLLKPLPFPEPDRRTSEIGVRIALGAEHRTVLRLVIAQGLRPVVAGAIAGLAATFWLTRFMASLLFGVEPYEPLTYGGVVVAVMAVATRACYVPARRGQTSVSPVVASHLARRHLAHLPARRRIRPRAQRFHVFG